MSLTSAGPPFQMNFTPSLAGFSLFLTLIVAWLAETHGVSVNAAYLGEGLTGRDFRWKRTKRSSRHQQTDEDRQDRLAAPGRTTPRPVFEPG